VFLNCSHPVTGKRKYVDTRGCVNWESNGYIYAMAGDLIAEDFEVGCDVKLVAPTSWRGLDTNRYSYAMMHTALLYGFDLSWIPLAGEDRCADTYCYFNSSSQTLECYKEGRTVHVFCFSCFHFCKKKLTKVVMLKLSLFNYIYQLNILSIPLFLYYNSLIHFYKCIHIIFILCEFFIISK